MLWGGVRVAEAQRLEAARLGERLCDRRARARVGILLAGFALMGVGLICFGVTVLRYSTGYFVAIPVRGPRLDQMISVAGIALPIAGFIALFVSIALERPSSG